MALAITTVLNTPTYKSWTVTSLDADTTGTFAHGFGSTPDAMIPLEVFFQGVTNPNFAVTGVTATSFTIQKTNSASSGGTTPGTTVVLKVVAFLPHSIL